MSRQRAADARGRRAEDIACWWLRLHGWRILARRVQARAVEVDIVAARGAVIAFVEVKRRRTGDAAVLALSPLAAARLREAAAALGPRFAARARRADAVWRCDLIALAPWTWPRHLRGVGV